MKTFQNSDPMRTQPHPWMREDYWIELRLTHGDQGMSYMVWGMNPLEQPTWKPSPSTIRVLLVRSCISATDAVARVLAGLPVVEEVWDVSAKSPAQTRP